jgi:hypothetical protein
MNSSVQNRWKLSKWGKQKRQRKSVYRMHRNFFTDDTNTLVMGSIPMNHAYFLNFQFHTGVTKKIKQVEITIVNIVSTHATTSKQLF